MIASDPYTIISAALIQTGNEPPMIAFDGTNEWTVGYNAYNLWLPYALESYDWSFQRQTGALTRVGNATFPQFTDAYAFPADSIHLISVWRSDTATTPPQSYPWGQQRANLFPMEYKVVGQTVECNAPNGLTGEWLHDISGADVYSTTFTLALIAYVASSIYAGLNEEVEIADATFKHAEALLDKAAKRVMDQQRRRTPMMASSLAGDPYTTISSALVQVGRQPPTSSWDGSDEWIAGWNAYQVWLPYCLEARDWKFQRVTGALVRTGDATWPRYTDAYQFPPNCLHLITVWRPDIAAMMPVYLGWGMTRDGLFPPQVEYKIIGQSIQTSAPDGLMAEWLSIPAGTDQYSATFNLALSAFVAAALAGSLNKDEKGAAVLNQKAEGLLEMAAAREGMQENRKVGFRSRMIERRRARYAPWGTTY